MLPQLDHQSSVSPLYQEYAEQLKTSGFGGEISFKYSARLAVATDNSVYQQVPQLVIHPRSIEDVQALSLLAAQEQFKEIKFYFYSFYFRN